MSYTRDPFTSKLFRVNLLSRNFIISELPTESEALRESPIFTVKTETAGHSNITRNWISEIQQSVSDQRNRLLEEKTTREFSTLSILRSPAFG